MNLVCLVLCLKNDIPASAPTLPPAKVNHQSRLSGMRLIRCTARALSIPKATKEKTFIITKYMIINVLIEVSESIANLLP